MTEATYTVAGMTCDHCATAIRTELTRIAGIHDVDIDLTAGTVTVHSHQPPLPEQIHTAITEAGYQLTA